MTSIHDLERMLTGRENKTLSDVFHDLLGFIRRAHSSTGKINQIIKQEDAVNDIERIKKARLFPDDIEIEYRSKALEADHKVAADVSEECNGVPTLLQEDVEPVLIRETLVIKGSSAAPREMSNMYVLLPDGSICTDDSHPLLSNQQKKDLVMRPSDAPSDYLGVLFEQVVAHFSVGGVVIPSAEMLEIPRLGRRINLSHIGLFDDSEGNDYQEDVIDELVLRIMDENYLKISNVRYDRLYVYDRSILIDCGGYEVISEVVDADYADKHALKSGLADSYARSKDVLCVYEHEDAAITLVDKIFPDSGDVFLYPLAKGVVDRLFSCYIFRSRPVAHVDRGWMVFDDRNLNIQFLGKIGEDEFRRQVAEYIRLRTALDASKTVGQLLEH